MSLIKTNKIQPHTADAVDISALKVNGAELSGTIHVSTLAELKALDSSALKPSQLAVVDKIPYGQLVDEHVTGLKKRSLYLDGGYSGQQPVRTEAGLLVPSNNLLDGVLAGPGSGVANHVNGFTVSFWFSYVAPPGSDNGSTTHIPLVGHGEFDPQVAPTSTSVSGWHIYLVWDAASATYHLGSSREVIGTGIVSTATDAGPEVTAGVWHHCVATANYTTGQLSMYLDGGVGAGNFSSVTTGGETGPGSGYSVQNTTLHVGRFKDPGGGYAGPVPPAAGQNTFSGNIDDLTLWKGALNQGELLGLVDTTNGGFLPSRIDHHPSFIAGNNYGWWSFGSDDGDSLLSDTGVIRNIGSAGSELDLVVNAGVADSGATDHGGALADLGVTMFSPVVPGWSGSSSAGTPLSPDAWSKKSIQSGSDLGEISLAVPDGAELQGLGTAAGDLVVFSAWIKPSSLPTGDMTYNRGVVFSRGSLYHMYDDVPDPDTDAWSGAGYFLQVTSAGIDFFWTDDQITANPLSNTNWLPGAGLAPTGINLLRHDTPVSIGVATNITIAVDYSSAKAVMYVNGQYANDLDLSVVSSFCGSGNNGTTFTPLATGGVDLCFGDLPNTNGNSWSFLGDIDDFAIWSNWAGFSTANVSSDAAAIYGDGCPGDIRSLTTTPLLAYLLMGDGAGDSLSSSVSGLYSVVLATGSAPTEVNVNNVVYNQSLTTGAAGDAVPYGLDDFSTGVCYAKAVINSYPPDSPGMFFWSPTNLGFFSYYPYTEQGEGAIDLGWIFIKPNDIAPGSPGSPSPGRWVSGDSLGSWTYALGESVGQVRPDNGLLYTGGKNATQQYDELHMSTLILGQGKNQQMFANGSVVRLTYSDAAAHSFSYDSVSASGGAYLPDIDKVEIGATITVVDGSDSSQAGKAIHIYGYNAGNAGPGGDSIDGGSTTVILNQAHSAVTFIKLTTDGWSTLNTAAPPDFAAIGQSCVTVNANTPYYEHTVAINSPFNIVSLTKAAAGDNFYWDPNNNTGGIILPEASTVPSGTIVMLSVSASAAANETPHFGWEDPAAGSLLAAITSASNFNLSTSEAVELGHQGHLFVPPYGNPITLVAVPADNVWVELSNRRPGVLDEDDFASDSSQALATQQSIKAYVTSAVGVGDDTLAVLAAATNVGVGSVANANVQLQVQEIGSALASPDPATVGIFQRSGANGNGAAISIIGGDTGESAINLGVEGDEDVGRISYDHNTNKMAFRVNGTGDLATIDGSGNVGIGVNDPDHKLEVAGRIHIGEVSGAPATTPVDNDGGVLYTKEDGELYWISNARPEVAVSDPGEETLTVLAAASAVGIGTASPGALLDFSTAPNEDKIHFGAPDVGIGQKDGTDMVLFSDSGGEILFARGSRTGNVKMAIDFAAGGVSIGHNVHSGTPPTSGLYVEGNLGIGETTPDTRLHVKSPADAAASTVTVEQLDVDEPFVNFVGANDGNAADSVQTSAGEAGNKTHAIKVMVNGTAMWMRLYDSPS